MRKKILWVLAAIINCGLTIATMTACSSDDDSTVDFITEGDDLTIPFTIEALEDGEIDLYLDINLPKPIYYSVNGKKKQTVMVAIEDKDEVESTTLDLKAGDKVQIFSENTTLCDYEQSIGFNIFFATKCYVYGNVMSLISPGGNWKDNKEIKEPYALSSLLSSTNIATHPTRRLMLPATKLTKGCYTHMFNNSKIAVAPELPATTVAERCYNNMFAYCNNLKKAPALPATKLAKECYSYMFWACEGLTTASELPATTLAESCYEYMFCWCTDLTDVPELPATQLTKDCYCGMFSSCTSLTKAPRLPATTLAENCYNSMFSSCEKITEAPALPATKMEPRCYYYMFNETGLTTAPDLPATTLAEACYEGMFSYCGNLTKAPALPATQLTKRCYANMFSRCKNLTGTIELPAGQLPEKCYYSMFYKCLKLNSIKCLATEMTGTFALMEWLRNAGTDESVSTRTLTHASGTPWINSDDDSKRLTDWFVPTGWTLVSQ